MNQTLRSFVLHFPADAGHETIMVHFVKELFEIQINHPLSSVLLVGKRLTHGVMGTATGTETEAVLRKSGIEYRSQHLTHGLLNQAIHHGGDAQLAYPAARLRDFNAKYRIRAIPERLRRSAMTW
jgi:hypothetical protein